MAAIIGAEAFGTTACGGTLLVKTPAFIAMRIAAKEATATPANNFTCVRRQTRRVSRANCGNATEPEVDTTAIEIFKTVPARVAEAVWTVLSAKIAASAT